MSWSFSINGLQYLYFFILSTPLGREVTRIGLGGLKRGRERIGVGLKAKPSKLKCPVASLPLGTRHDILRNCARNCIIVINSVYYRYYK